MTELRTLREMYRIGVKPKAEAKPELGRDPSKRAAWGAVARELRKRGWDAKLLPGEASVKLQIIELGDRNLPPIRLEHEKTIKGGQQPVYFWRTHKMSTAATLAAKIHSYMRLVLHLKPSQPRQPVKGWTKAEADRVIAFAESLPDKGKAK